ncbi:hypothetical protein V6Z12_D04G034100 [Gossypium hirsutum]
MNSLPSPPPWGWSTGFITTPLTTGHLPSQHLDPALPKIFWFTPTFPTCSTVVEQFLDIKRTSPEGNFNVADFPSFAISFATAAAALANCPPLPSVISINVGDIFIPPGKPFELPLLSFQFASDHQMKCETRGASGSAESINLYEELLNSITYCCRAFPIFIGTSVPKTMVSPIIAPLGCKIYLFSPSL